MLLTFDASTKTWMPSAVASALLVMFVVKDRLLRYCLSSMNFSLSNDINFFFFVAEISSVLSLTGFKICMTCLADGETAAAGKASASSGSWFLKGFPDRNRPVPFGAGVPWRIW